MLQLNEIYSCQHLIQVEIIICVHCALCSIWHRDISKSVSARRLWRMWYFCDIVNYRRFWYIPCVAEFFHPLCHVHLLCIVSSGATLPEIPLVEKVHDHFADCTFFVYIITI